MILLFGRWPAAAAAVLVVVTGVFFVVLGLLWLWVALTFTGLQSTVFWALVLVAAGLVVLVGGIVAFRRIPKETRRVFASEPKDPL